MKGLVVFIQGRDCTRGGVTSGREMAVLVGPGLPEIFEPTEERPALRLVFDLHPVGAQAGRLMVAKPDWLHQVDPDLPRRKPDPTDFLKGGWVERHAIVRARAVPVDHDDEKGWSMYGGHDIHTSDSRFPFAGPLPVHDRYE